MGELIRIGLIRIGAEEGAPGLGATVDTTGAWVTELTLDGSNILFPRQTLTDAEGTKKFRGGLHVCSPYFGLPKYLEDMIPAHGYARNVGWGVDDTGEDYVVLSHTMERVEPVKIDYTALTSADNAILEETRNEMDYISLISSYYHGLTSKLSIGIIEEEAGVSTRLGLGLDLELELSNSDKNTASIPVSPGFHPYFNKLSGFDHLETNIPKPFTADLPNFGDDSREINMHTRDGLHIRMISNKLRKAVQWTDRLEGNDYTCVEPVLVYKGSIGNEFSAVKSIMLEPGQTERFDLKILFSGGATGS